MRCNKKLREFRLKAGLSQNKLAREADLDRATVSNAESGKEVQELTVVKIIGVLSERLGSNISVSQITG